MVDEMSLDGQGGTPVLPASVINQYGASYPNLGTDLSMGPFYVSNYTVSSTQMVMYRTPYSLRIRAIVSGNISLGARLRVHRKP